MNESVSAYPLQFPIAQPRTKTRQRSQFKLSFARARDELLNELDRLGAVHITLSSNIELRRDGLPYSNRTEPTDPGIAVYFSWRKKQYCLACDKWDRTKDNIRAISLHIAALRGQERWGVGSIEQAFEGYKRLPAKTEGKKWWEELEIESNANADEIQSAYRKLAMQHHPDNGGDRSRFEQINQAYQQAKSTVNDDEQ
jgi:DnaJ domain